MATRSAIVHRNITTLRIVKAPANIPLYAGTTVNERLSAAGLIKAWDTAVTRRDRAKMLEVLLATGLTAEQAAFTADTILADLEKEIWLPARQ
jgi:hypothetical protein